jgi:hypothetical protein
LIIFINAASNAGFLCVCLPIVQSTLSFVGGFIVSLIPSGTSTIFSGAARRGAGIGGQQRFRPPVGTGPGAQRFEGDGMGAGAGAGLDGVGQGRGFTTSPPSEENIATLMVKCGKLVVVRRCNHTHLLPTAIKYTLSNASFSSSPHCFSLV